MAETIRIINEGCLGPTCDFFTKSKVGVTASLVVEASALTLGILALIHLLPGVGTLCGALLTGGGGSLMILTTTLAAYRSCGKSGEKREDPFALPDFSIDEDLTWQARLKQIQEKTQVVFTPPKVPPQECLDTLCLLIEGSPSSKLFKKTLSCPDPTSQEMVELVKTVKSKKGELLYGQVAKIFLENLPSFNVFLTSRIEELLQQEPTDAMRASYTRTKKQIRRVLLYLIDHESQKGGFLNVYKEYTQRVGDPNGVGYQACHPLYYFAHLRSLETEPNGNLSELLFLLSIYRRYALLRLFPEKINSFEESTDVAAKTLVRATWFHGTRALTSLRDSDWTLMPTDWLRQVGFTSFFGEMGEGCQSDGINASALSGTILDRVDVAIRYAKKFSFTIDKEKQRVDVFINEMGVEKEENPYSCLMSYTDYAVKLPRVEAALKRCLLWEPQSVNVDKIRERLAHFDEAEKIITSQRPKELFNWHDDCYISQFNTVRHCVARMRLFLDRSLTPLTEEQKEAIQNNFPAVLGSSTLIAHPVSYLDEVGEHIVMGSAQIGQDVQLICVSSEDKEKAGKWVPANVEILTFDDLSRAQGLNHQISPQLSDILSINKFTTLLKNCS